MNNDVFFYILITNITLYLSIISIVVVVYHAILRKYIVSLYDPLLISFVASAFSTSVVIFLFLINQIKLLYFKNYIFTIIIFYASFVLLSRKSKVRRGWINFDLTDNPTVFFLPNNYFAVFFILTLIVVFSQLLLYFKMGIPLFLESRLEVALSGGGIGLFIRLADTPRYITLFMAFYIVFYDKSKFHKYYAFCYFAVSIMVFVLSGSKSTFLVIIQLFGIFVFFNQSRCKRALEIYKKDMLKYFIVCLIFAFLVIFMQNAVNVFWGIMSFFMRLVASGDVYYFAYTNDNITKLPKTDLFIFLFGDFLRTVRLIPQNTRGLGYILNDIVHDTENSVVGPTIRFNVEGYVNFGFFGSMIFSFFCAWILATSRNFFIKSRNATAYIQLLAVVLYKNSIPIETGPSVTFSYFTTDVFLTGLICVYVYFITRYCKVRI